MYNTNLQESGYQTLNQSYNLNEFSMYKSLDKLVGNYSTNDSSKVNMPIDSDSVLQFATHKPFSCGCDYHDHN